MNEPPTIQQLCDAANLMHMEGRSLSAYVGEWIIKYYGDPDSNERAADKWEQMQKLFEDVK